MNQMIFRNLLMLVFIVGGMIGRAHGATYPTSVSISPTPFSSGDIVNINATVSGPLTTSKQYISVISGTVPIIFSPINREAVPAGSTKTFSIPWKVPADLRSSKLFVSTVFVEDNDTFVGEPVPPQLILVARCPFGRSGRGPCKYATAKYWLITTKRQPK